MRLFQEMRITGALLPAAALLFTACPTGTGTPPERCMKVSEVVTTEVSPAGVQTVFQVRDCKGEPVTDLKNKQLEVRLDGDPIQSEGGKSKVLNQSVDFKQYALVLLDMSDSIVDSGALSPMLDAARSLIDTLVRQGTLVAVYRFAGPQYFAEVQSFTNDAERLDEGLNHLAESEGLGTTDLYGSIARALSVLEPVGDSTVLSARSLVVFTDGTDEARESTFEATVAAVKATEANVFTVGLGGDVNKKELRAFGKTGFEWAEDTDKLDAAFERVTERLTKLSRSFYLVGVCSPRTRGIREMSLVVTRGAEAGGLTVTYNADGFDIVGCEASRVAYPCKERECGSVDGFYCGGCETGEFCDEDATCQDACEGYVCGESNGTSCGRCEGETEICEDHHCVDACNAVECGTVLGVDCGDCSALGETFGCDADYQCVDACGEVECGEVLGVSCGGCEDGMTCGDDGRCQPRTIDGMSWVQVPGGEVTLGCDFAVDESCDFDAPAHGVLLSDFWMMTTEVTVGMYRTCVEEGACDPSHIKSGDGCNLDGADDRQPLNCVDWEGLGELCAFVDARLPTEAEFERALRGDHDGAADTYWIYPWGNRPAPSCDTVVMNAGGPGCGTDETVMVGSLAASPLGLFDIVGNVAEWTADYYSETFEFCEPEPCEDPVGPADGAERVVRGGAFDDLFASAFRSAKRDKAPPELTSPAVGGRCVK